MQHPAARTRAEVDQLAGVVVPDPYRWLEDGAADEVRAWQRQQNERASEHVRSWPGFSALRALVEQYAATRTHSLPHPAGGHWFRVDADVQSRAVVIRSDGPCETGSVVYEPPDVDGDVSPQLAWISPSPDGRLLAVGVCEDGSEQNHVRLIDLTSGQQLPAPSQQLMDSWCGGAIWLEDSSGFYATVLDGSPTQLQLSVVFHRIADASTVVVNVPWTTDRDYRMVLPSRDGRYLLAVERAMNPVPVAVAALDDAAAPTWSPFVTDMGLTLAGQIIGDEYVAVTDLDAPRGRVVAVPLTRPETEHWRTVVPESEAVLRSLAVVAGRLYVSEFVNTYARVRICAPDGTELGEVPLPGKGALAEGPFPFMALARRSHAGEFLFSFSTLTSSAGLYRHRPDQAQVDTLKPPALVLHDAVVEDRWARSADGTQVPFHVLRPANATGPQPSLIHAYGGFNVPLLPGFPGPLAAFVAAGGTLVHAHLRGGAELGREWWEGGRLEHKHHCFEDLYAIAETIIADGTTTPEQLAVTGGSNGGLLAGVAVTQRPELWAAAVPRVPLLDLIGACRDPYGRHGITVELADPDDADEVSRLLSFSPYHLVREGAYPAVFVDAGDTDPRCPPWHARKFVARLQAAQRGERPVLLRIWENAGHGGATAPEVAIEQCAEWLAFLARHTGLPAAEEPHA